MGAGWDNRHYSKGKRPRTRSERPMIGRLGDWLNRLIFRKEIARVEAHRARYAHAHRPCGGEHRWSDIPDPGGYVGVECLGCNAYWDYDYCDHRPTVTGCECAR